MVREGDFDLKDSAVPEPGPGEFLLRTVYLSVDPYMRGMMSDRKSYAEPVDIGAVMTGQVVGVVEKSNHDRFKEGEIVVAATGWQEYSVCDGTDCRKVNPDYGPISTSLHVLGMPGLTAYFGLLRICQPEAGQTVVVSGAAGAVGSTVGQIAKIMDCRAVGIAGSKEKTDWITGDLGFAAAVNYRDESSIYRSLKQHCPDGVHAYFDNVGGPITDAVFPLLAVGGRVAVCGQISQYNMDEAPTGPRLLWHLIVKRATLQGFLIFDFAKHYREGLIQLSEWVSSGRVKYRESIADGFEKAPGALVGLFQGDNIGKQLVKVSDL